MSGWRGVRVGTHVNCLIQTLCDYMEPPVLTIYSHQTILPPRTQKCDRQPSRRHTEGCNDARPFPSRVTSQRGLTPLRSIISSRSPHPQGQRNPTHQSSPSSRARTRPRRGNWLGKLSPSTTVSLWRGANRASSRRNQNERGLMRRSCAF